MLHKIVPTFVTLKKLCYVVTSHKSLPLTTPVKDPFLNRLLQMLQVDQIATNLLIVPGHKISERARVTDPLFLEVFIGGFIYCFVIAGNILSF